MKVKHIWVATTQYRNLFASSTSRTCPISTTRTPSLQAAQTSKLLTFYRDWCWDWELGGRGVLFTPFHPEISFKIYKIRLVGQDKEMLENENSFSLQVWVGTGRSFFALPSRNIFRFVWLASTPFKCLKVCFALQVWILIYPFFSNYVSKVQWYPKNPISHDIFWGPKNHPKQNVKQVHEVMNTLPLGRVQPRIFFGSTKDGSNKSTVEVWWKDPERSQSFTSFKTYIISDVHI